MRVIAATRTTVPGPARQIARRHAAAGARRGMGTVAGMGLARTERQALVTLLQEVGPGRPTLCEGWDTGDLVAHLLVRERRPDAALGMVLPPLRGHARRVQERIDERPWPARLATLAAGPPGWNPMGWGPLEELTNGAEFLVHHEDARRGEPGWQPRELDPQTAQQVRALLGSGFVKLMAKRLDVGVVAVLPDERVRLADGSPSVELVGEPLEVVLWLFGRRECRVTLGGDPAAVERVEQADRSA